MRKFPARETRGRSASASVPFSSDFGATSRRDRRAWLTLWLQGRRRARLTLPAPPSVPVPATLNPVAWLRADDVLLADQSPVHVWPARAGLDLTLVTEAAPTFVQSGLGGEASLAFTGVETLAEFGMFSFEKPCSLFVVWRCENTAEFSCLAIFNAVGVALAVLVETGEIYFDYYYSPNLSVAGQFEWGEDWACGVAVSAGDVTLLKNDVPVELGLSCAPGELALTGVGVGYETEGLVSEVVVFDRLLTVAERAGLQTYFNERYGL